MDPILPTTIPPQPAPRPAQSTTGGKIVYALYLLSLVSGVTLLVGVIWAYVNIGDASEPLRSHYRFQIRTFWIGLLYSLIGLLLALAIVGAFVFVFVAVWLIIRCVKGFKALDRGEAYPNVETWLW